MTPPPGNPRLPAGRQERQNAGTVALTGPSAPLLGPVGGSIMNGGLYAPPASVPPLQDDQHGLQIGPVLGINSIASLETQPFFYAGKEACA